MSNIIAEVPKEGFKTLLEATPITSGIRNPRFFTVLLKNSKAVSLDSASYNQTQGLWWQLVDGKLYTWPGDPPP